MINTYLKNFCAETRDVLGCAMINIDGVITASALGRKVDDDLVGGISSTMLGVGERIAAELMDSNLEQVFVRSANGYVMIHSIGKEALLLVMATKQAKLGLLFLEMQKTADELESVIASNAWQDQ